MLDIIMPHYDEPWEVGKPFFEMLALQRCVDMRQVRVLLIHDGTPEFPEYLFLRYPFKVVQYQIEHKGVSAARNFGIEKSDAEWISFNDFDDTYTSVFAMKLIFDSLNPNFDLLWNPIYMEDFSKGFLRVFPMTVFNMIFIHNKYIRREFLMETGLRFNEDLQYSEDSAFLAVMNIMLEKGKIGEIKTPEPLYVWAYRPGSCTTDSRNAERNIRHLFEANKYISREMERLGYDGATLMKFRAMTDAYFALTSKDCPDCGDLKKEVGKYWMEYRQDIGKLDKNDLHKVFMASGKYGKKIPENEDRPKFADWLKEVI